MTSITRIRIAALIAAAAALAIPSAALAGKSHQTDVYKVEDHVELEGEDGTYTLSCKPGDVAVDGMWRVDNVDQDNDWTDPDGQLASFWGPAPTGIDTSPDLTIRKAIRPMAAYASSASTYTFQFTPLAGADVQLKLFLTCLPDPVSGAGHSHTWTEGGQFSNAASVVAKTSDPQSADTTAACTGSTILIQPGFETTSTGNHVVASRPTPPGGPPGWNGKRWLWRVWNDGTDPAGTTTLTWRCLAVKSSTGGSNNHTHKLVFNKKETTWDSSAPAAPALGPKQKGERQQHCGEHYKGMLGGWDISGAWRTAGSAGPVVWPDHMWIYFLGMDPRIKSRAFSLLNLDEISSPTAPPGKPITTSLVCWKDRTT